VPTSAWNRSLAAEAAAFGLGYGSVLCWASVCLVGSFGGGLRASPSWSVIPWLRTDTTGLLAFVLAAISLVISKYLRLRRAGGAVTSDAAAPRPAALAMVQAVAETAAFLSTGVVVYLSVNAITHNYTLELQLTHLLPGPSEGTARVLALLLTVVSVAVGRYLRSTANAGAGIRPTARVGGSADRAA
jgi:hypothetical protein